MDRRSSASAQAACSTSEKPTLADEDALDFSPPAAAASANVPACIFCVPSKM